MTRTREAFGRSLSHPSSDHFAFYSSHTINLAEEEKNKYFHRKSETQFIMIGDKKKWSSYYHRRVPMPAPVPPPRLCVIWNPYVAYVAHLFYVNVETIGTIAKSGLMPWMPYLYSVELNLS